MNNLIRISEQEDCIVYYDKERGMYRVSVFEDNHFWDEFWFDAYEEKEFDNLFPQTIGNITYYSKEELFEWVENQQKLNKILIQEGYLKTINTCSEKWYVKNYNLNKGIDRLSEYESNSILQTLSSSKIKPYSQEEKIEAERKIEYIKSLRNNFDTSARC